MPSEIYAQLLKDFVKMNPKEVHPASKMIESLGFQYLRLASHGVRLMVVDEKRVMLARLRHGF